MSINPVVLAAILLTVLSWGVYGPVLHIGQEHMDMTRLRSLICVGLAYFLISVVGPLVVIYVFGVEADKTAIGRTVPPGESAEIWNWPGFWWSLAGGTAGALGAIGIVIALSNGGSPSYVMPMVFGGAPVVTALTYVAIRNQWHLLGERPLFFVGLAVVIVGAVLVMTNAPPPPKPAAHGSHAAGPEKPAKP